MIAAAAIGCCLAYQSANAALTLTAAGIADGFGLSTFYSGDPSTFYGLLDFANGNAGQVIATSYARTQLELLNDVDGQTPAAVILSVPAPGSAAYGIVTTPNGAVYYGAQANGYYQVNKSTLALTEVTGLQQVAGQTPLPYLGLWANPVTGDLLSSSYQGLIDINPTTGAVNQLSASVGFDGVTVSPDGQTACGEYGGNIYCYVISKGLSQVPTVFSGNGHAPDGTAFITGGTFNNDLIVNNNDDTVGLIDTTTGIETIIASGGTRGDFVSPDLSNDSLFLALADSVDRLTIAGGTIGCGANCGSPGPTSAVPEPTTLGLPGLGFVSLAFVRRRT